MSVGMVTGMTTGRPRNRVSIPGRGMRFLVFQSVEKNLKPTHPYSLNTDSFFQRVKAAGE